MKLCSSPGMYTSDETISKENQLVRLLIFFRLWSFIGSILLPYYHVAKEAIDWACLDLVLRPFLHIGWNLPPFTMFDYNCERTKVFISWYMNVRVRENIPLFSSFQLLLLFFDYFLRLTRESHGHVFSLLCLLPCCNLSL